MKKEIYDAYMLNALPVGLDENFIGKKIHLPILVEKDEDGFCGRMSLFRDAIRREKTLDEALKNTHEVIELCLEEQKEEIVEQLDTIQEFSYHALNPALYRIKRLKGTCSRTSSFFLKPKKPSYFNHQTSCVCASTQAFSPQIPEPSITTSGLFSLQGSFRALSMESS